MNKLIKWFIGLLLLPLTAAISLTFAKLHP